VVSVLTITLTIHVFKRGHSVLFLGSLKFMGIGKFGWYLKENTTRFNYDDQLLNAV